MLNTINSIKSTCGAALVGGLRTIRWYPHERRCPIIKQALIKLPKADLIYATYISRRYRYVYMDNPKTGCTSLKAALVQLEIKDRHLGIDLSDWRTYHDRSLCPLTCLNDLLYPTSISTLQEKKYRFITFVRNPYSRLLSCYRDKILKGKPQKTKILELLGYHTSDLSIHVDFDEFVRSVVEQSDCDMDPHWRVQSTQILNGLMSYTFIGRFENYTSDFVRALQAIDIDEMAIPEVSHLCRSNFSMTEGCRDAFKPALKALVYERYRADFENFGYSDKLPE